MTWLIALAALGILSAALVAFEVITVIDEQIRRHTEKGLNRWS